MEVRIVDIKGSVFQYSIEFHIDNKKVQTRTQPRTSIRYSQSLRKQHHQTNPHVGDNHAAEPKKTVRFVDKPEILKKYVWLYAHSTARKGEWEQFSINRMHFSSRIQRLSEIISPMLQKKYEKTKEEKMNQCMG